MGRPAAEAGADGSAAWRVAEAPASHDRSGTGRNRGKRVEEAVMSSPETSRREDTWPEGSRGGIGARQARHERRPQRGGEDVATEKGESGERSGRTGSLTDRGERPRTWFERNGGVIVILFVFGMVALMVVAKNACG